MKQSKYENGAILMENGVVLEEKEVDVYMELCKEVDKLLKNVDGLGKKELPNGSEEEIRDAGLNVLKTNYAAAYKKLIAKIGELANNYIKMYCFNLLFYKDAADSMLVDPLETVKEYITEKRFDVNKAIFTDYSVDEFIKIVNEIREKVTSLAMLNWEKHKELSLKGK